MHPWNVQDHGERSWVTQTTAQATVRGVERMQQREGPGRVAGRGRAGWVRVSGRKGKRADAAALTPAQLRGKARAPGDKPDTHTRISVYFQNSERHRLSLGGFKQQQQLWGQAHRKAEAKAGCRESGGPAPWRGSPAQRRAPRLPGPRASHPGAARLAGD